MKKYKQPILTIGQFLDAVFSEKYDNQKIKEIKKWQQQRKKIEIAREVVF